MQHRKLISMRIDPEVGSKAKLIAKASNRSFSNLVEYLLINEIERFVKLGFDSVFINTNGGEVIGKKGDEDDKLKQDHDSFLREQEFDNLLKDINP